MSEGREHKREGHGAGKGERSREDHSGPKPPDRSELDARIREHQDKMTRWKAEKEKFNKQLATLEAARKEKVRELEEIRGSLQSVISEQSRLKSEKRRLFSERDGHRERLRALRGSGRDGGRRARSEADVSRDLDRLEYKHSTESMGVEEERALMKEMAALREERRMVAVEGKAREKARREEEAIKAALAEVDAAVKRVAEELASRSAVFDGANAAVKAASDKVRAGDQALREVRSKRSTLLGEMKAEFEALKEFRKDYDQQVAKFREAMKEVHRKRDEERREREKEERRVKAEQKRKEQAQRDEAERKRMPWEEHVRDVWALIHNLHHLAPEQASAFDEANSALVEKHAEAFASLSAASTAVTVVGGVRLMGAAGAAAARMEEAALEAKAHTAVAAPSASEDGKALRLVTKKGAGKEEEEDDMDLSAFASKKSKKDRRRKGGKGRRGGKAKEAAAGGGAKAVVFAREVEEQFERVKVSPPDSLEAVPTSLSALHARLDYYASTPDPRKVAFLKRDAQRKEQKAAASKLSKGDAVSSFLGLGEVHHVRGNNIVVVHMKSFGAVAYLQATALTKVEAGAGAAGAGE